MFLSHNSAIFRPIGLKIVMVTEKTTIYRSVIKNSGFGL